MRNVLIALALASLVGLGASGGASADNRGADQLAAGTGTLICCGQPMVHVNAQSDAGGADPRGHFWIRYPNGVEFGGRVVCLTVGVNQAGLTGHIEKAKTASPTQGFVPGNFVNLRLTDNGSPGTLDLVNFDEGTPTQPTCFPGGDLPISQGNYIVHDEPVLDLLGLDQLLAQFESAANDPYG